MPIQNIFIDNYKNFQHVNTKFTPWNKAKFNICHKMKLGIYESNKSQV